MFAFVLALVAAAEEEKTLKVLPYAYNAFPYTYGAYNSPLAYNTPYAYSGYHHATAAYPYIQPVATKVVPKEFEVEVKSYEFEPVSTGCKNQFGFDVPCAKSKRSADEEETKPVLPFLPISYNALPYAHPGFGYSTYSPAAAYGVAPYYPYLTYALPVGTCKNVEGELVPCAKQVVKRSADDEEKKVLTYAAAAYNPFPYNYNYATPYGYNALPFTTYAAAPVATQEIQVPTPVFKTTVEKISLQPRCLNYLGMFVDCNLA